MTPEEWARVKAIAIAAAERADADRLEYVTSACAGDGQLLREVTSLVVAMSEAGDRLEPPSHSFDDALTALDDLSSTRVGAYEILSPIGAGGMGEVYKARDTRLDRIVAVKVLPARASGDAVSRERMTREARAVAALTHPHICTIYDVGVHEGRDFFVMEYLDGETLASRLARGSLPVPDALRVAGQIASALDEAHQAGIVHRDVKPANIMIVAGRTASGPAQAKLLDFGIAKASKPEPLPLPIQGEGAAAAGLTLWGVVPGTAHYVAPEVLDGVSADARTDIFALGAVLFEMLTGRKAFEGSERGDVLAAVRGADVPRPSSLRPELPAALDRIVLRCLARKPEARYQSMHGVLDDLRAVERRIDSSSRRRVLAAAGVLAIAIAGTVAWAIWPGRARADIVAPSIIRLPASAGVRGTPALSPDGSSLVFSWADETIDNVELMLLRVGSNERVRLTTNPGTEEWPAWSPDGRTIAFIRCGTGQCGIFTLPAAGGPERKLRDLRDDRYYCLAWAPDGRSLAYAERVSKTHPYALFVLSLDTLAVRQLTNPLSGHGELRFAFSPDGKTIAAIGLPHGGPGVHLLSLETGTDTMLLSGQQEWFGGIAWSAEGRHLILSANQQGVRRLWRLPIAGGDLEPLTIAGEDAYYPAVSKDGLRLVFVRELRDWDISRIGFSAGRVTTATPFPSSPRIDLDPVFSPDGRKLAFVSERSGTRQLWVSHADGSQAEQLTSLNGELAGRPSWSPDGEYLAFHAAGINVIPAAGGAPRKISNDGEAPSWSADGAWIYFTRNPGGGYRIWKVPVQGGTAVEVVATEAIAARESPDRAYLYYVKLPGGIWRRPVDGGNEMPVVEDFTWTLPGYWALTREGIYYTVREQQRDNTFVHHLRFFDVSTRRSRALGTLPGNTDDWVGGLTVSPDRRTLLYTQRAYQSSEIVMIEPFR